MSSPILDYFKKNSSHIFIKSDTIALTYFDCLNIIYYLTQALKEHNILKKRVLLCIPNSIESQLLFLALCHTNDVVLLNPEHNNFFIENFQKEFDIDIIISERNFLNSIDFLKHINFNLSLRETYTAQEPELYPGDICLMTSGTTGKPSPVVIMHKEITEYGKLLLSYFDIGVDDCLYNIIPFYHGYGLTRLITVIVSGSSVFIPKTVSATRIIDDINQYRCTWTSLIPRLIKIINKNQTELWESFKFATSSSALIDIPSLSKFQDITKKPIFVEYGCSEASIISSNTFSKNKPGSMGKVNTNQCKIKDGKIMVIPAWKNSTEYIDTGDIGFIDSDNFLWINGRSKEIIKKNGRTIFPYELEFVIQQFPGVEDVAAYSINPMSDRESIGVVYVGECSEETVIKLCQQHFLPFYRPDHVFKIKSIPYQGNKLKRLEINNYVNSLQ